MIVLKVVTSPQHDTVCVSTRNVQFDLPEVRREDSIAHALVGVVELGQEKDDHWPLRDAARLADLRDGVFSPASGVFIERVERRKQDVDVGFE